MYWFLAERPGDTFEVHQARGRLLSVSQNTLILQCQSVPSAGFSHESLKITAVADGPFQIFGQLIWHVYGKPAIPLSTIQCIAGVSLAGLPKPVRRSRWSAGGRWV